MTSSHTEHFSWVSYGKVRCEGGGVSEKIYTASIHYKTTTNYNKEYKPCSASRILACFERRGNYFAVSRRTHDTVILEYSTYMKYIIWQRLWYKPSYSLDGSKSCC